MAPLTSLAQEVVDYIIDCLHGDVKSLRNCALVSTSWTPRAQRNIFAEVTLPFRHDGVPTGRFTQLQDIVQQSPKIALMPRRVCLLGDELAAFPPSPEGSPAAAAVQLFPNIREVAVVKFTCQSLPEIAESILAAVPAVAALSIEDVCILEIPLPGGRVWLPPQSPVVVQIAPSGPVHHRPPTLRKLSIRNLQALQGVAQCESFALAENLAQRGQLSSLVSLELLSRPGVTQTWLPFLPSIGRNLQRCAVTINDVVPHRSVSFYRALTEEQLHESITRFYNALLACPHLHSLGIKYDGLPTYAKALEEAYEDPTLIPRTSPYFLQELTALLSRADVPFPKLEALIFDVLSTVEGLSLFEDAWTALRDALCTPGRYPCFWYLHVELEEMGTGFGPWSHLEHVQCRNADVRAALLRAQLGMFQGSGITISVATRDSKAVMW
ncbi:hypothetical protein OH76DRAFT_1488701 [Lentinus brumalis]|uniref:F-box domain-containing protein n=1 Tax=Lentinus brumalis TaxID=2498619 RepID=A0A371CQ57_9APHY|nr:hypothetical protein OH76DRAFT_1488701 [Polyporus brumalis]